MAWGRGFSGRDGSDGGRKSGEGGTSAGQAWQSCHDQKTGVRSSTSNGPKWTTALFHHFHPVSSTPSHAAWVLVPPSALSLLVSPFSSSIAFRCASGGAFSVASESALAGDWAWGLVCVRCALFVGVRFSLPRPLSSDAQTLCWLVVLRVMCDVMSYMCLIAHLTFRRLW